jgi:excinuclease ABC subunit B
MTEKDIGREIKRLERQRVEHARNLEFEEAARVRDQLADIKRKVFGVELEGDQPPAKARA